MREITAENFTRKFINTKDRLNVTELSIRNDLVISGNSYFTKENSSLIFRKCEIKELILADVEAKFLYFKNCKIQNLQLMSCKIQRFFIEDETIIGSSLSMINCEIGSIEFQKTQIYSGEVSLRNLTCDTFDTNLLFAKGGIKIRDSKFKNQCRFYNINAGQYGIDFIKSTFDDNVFLVFGEMGGIVFNDSIFTSAFTIDATEINNNLSLVNTIFKESFRVTASSDYRKDDGTSGIKNAPLPKQLYIVNSTFEEDFNLNGEYKGEANKGSIEKAVIRASEKLHGNIYFSNLRIDNIELNGSLYNSDIYFRKVKSNHVQINEFSNFKILQFQNFSSINSDSKFEIISSNLGKTHFFDVDFNSFGQLLIENSLLTEIATSNVMWSSSINLSKSDTINSKNHYRQLRETYRQLKYALRNNGDTIKALKFEGLEMEAYKNQLENDKSRFGERIILWSNQSNDYGQNWIKPLGLLLYANAIFFLLIVFCSEKFAEIKALWSLTSVIEFYGTFFNSLGKYFYFLNPVHNLRHIYPETWNNNWSLFWDTASRVVNAYFIFQMISAFRKYSKR